MCLTGIESVGGQLRVNGVLRSTTSSCTWRKTNLRLVVDQQRARQQSRLAEDLEAVADAEHEPALVGELDHRLHHRREAGDRAGAQIVAVGEAAGDDDGVDALQVAVAVPEQLGLADAQRRRAAASTSSQVPGKRMTPNFTRSR